MENAAEALKMAAAVLIFVLALGISILSFSNARSTAQVILEYKDREYDYSYVNSNAGTERIVSAETMIPTITRAYKENYKIFFYEKYDEDEKIPLDLFIDKTLQKDGEDGRVNYIDLEKEKLADDAQKERFIQYILYGKDEQREFTNKIENLQPGGIYDTILKGNTYKEKLGEYYQEDLDGNSDNVPTNNKTKKRIISYIAQ